MKESITIKKSAVLIGLLFSAIMLVFASTAYAEVAADSASVATTGKAPASVYEIEGEERALPGADAVGSTDESTFEKQDKVALGVSQEKGESNAASGSASGSSKSDSPDKNTVEKKDDGTVGSSHVKSEATVENNAVDKSASSDSLDSVASAAPAEKIGLTGSAHVQDKGTIKAESNPGGKLTLGTTGKGKQLEGISIKLNEGKGVSYGVHIQNVGWQAKKNDGAFAGTTGKALQVEAAWVKLEMDGYSVWYRAHVAGNGWLGWTSNGKKAGSEGLAKRMEALEVIVLPDGQVPDGYDPKLASFLQKMVVYSSHIQDIGNKLGYSISLGDTITLGTTGQAKHLEGISIKLNGVSGGISYKTHIQDIGWQATKKNGVFAGTKGQAKQVEAAQIMLTGELAKGYDVFYRAHVSNIGWMAWTKNGSSVGTVSCAVPIEALQLKIVPKGDNVSPSTKGICYLDPSKLPSMTYESISEGRDWVSVGTSGVSGTTGEGLALTGISMKSNSGNPISGGISYLAHFANAGWTSWYANGERDTNSWNPVQALRIKLTGEMSKYFDVYYRSHVSGYGWMGWASNGASSGTTGLARNAEAYQVRIVVKGSAAPGSTAKSYSDRNGFLGMPPDQRAMLNRIANYSSGTRYLIAVNRGTHKVGIFSGSSGNWSLQYYWSCVTGAPSTPTITGTFRTTGGKRMSLSTDSRAKWCTQINGGYFFHTILASESELGHSLSHGCLRMAYPSARWIYDNIQRGTTVTIYN